jgi:septal ring factor EnvC (AmiA/AmiB activator)
MRGDMTDDLGARLAALQATVTHISERQDEARTDHRAVAADIGEIKSRLTSLERDVHHNQTDSSRVEKSVVQVSETVGRNTEHTVASEATMAQRAAGRADLMKILGIAIAVASFVASIVTTILSFAL